MIKCSNVKFSYPNNSFNLNLKSLIIPSGKNFVLKGSSGCGKTTIFKLLSGIHIPDSGEILLNDISFNKMITSDVKKFRLNNIGLIPQNYELLDYLNVAENLTLIIKLSSNKKIDSKVLERIDYLAKKAGIIDLLKKYPNEISQGEKQRVVICRSLMSSPSFILADEPTGNLDPKNKDNIVQLLIEESSVNNSTLFVITHDLNIVKYFDASDDVMELVE